MKRKITKIKRILPWLLGSWALILLSLVITIQILEPGTLDEAETVSGVQQPVSTTEEAASEEKSPKADEHVQDSVEETPAVDEAVLAERHRLETLDEQQIWEELGSYSPVLIGDSRVVGFSIYGFVEKRLVLAENGATINDLTKKIDAAASIAPKYVFVAYGINDIREKIGRTPEGYAEYVESKVAALQERLPDTVIFIQSVLPAREFLYSSTPAYREVGEYNNALREMSERNGWPFVDNSEIAQNNAGLYANDGIHLGAGFYKFWGQNMLLAIFDEEHGL